MAGNYAAYLVELALPDYGMLKYSYSMVAAAAVQLTNRCPRDHRWFLARRSVVSCCKHVHSTAKRTPLLACTCVAP